MSERQIMGAAAAGSLLLHVLIGLLFAYALIQAGALDSPFPAPKPKPKEIVIIPEIFAPEVKPKRERPYVRTSQNAPAENAPERPDFQSDRNTIAATEQEPDPNATAPLPTQDGNMIPSIELVRREYKDGEIADDASQGSRVPEESAPSPPTPPEIALPEPKPLEPRIDIPEPEPVKPDMLVAKAETPPRTFRIEGGEMELIEPELPKTGIEIDDAPALEVPTPDVRKPLPIEEPDPPRPEIVNRPPAPRPSPAMKIGELDNAKPDAFQPQTRKHRLAGTLSNRGDAAVAAEATPVGRYMRQVTGAIEKRWHYNRRKFADFVSYGNLRLRFYVNKNGRAEDVVVLENDSNAVMTDFTLEAILGAEIPKIPEELLDILDDERVEITYNVIIY